MSDQTRFRALLECKLGFTLLELLVVMAIMAIVAGSVIATLGGTGEHATEQVAQAEMAELKKAILQFRRDTGWLPKQGPFSLQGLSLQGAAILPSGKDAAWFDSPANFYQLFENPLDPAHPLAAWNPDTGRGWHGPYLSRGGPMLVTMGQDLEVPGVADRFAHPPDGGLYAWRTSQGPLSRWGRPYLLLDIDLPQPYLLSFGPNGRYESGAGDDIVLFLFQ